MGRFFVAQPYQNPNYDLQGKELPTAQLLTF
jgi:hypothetical protein